MTFNIPRLAFQTKKLVTNIAVRESLSMFIIDPPSHHSNRCCGIKVVVEQPTWSAPTGLVS